MSQFQIAGKTFEYKRPTLTFIRKIAKANYEKMFDGLQYAIHDDKAHRAFKKGWKRFCRDVIQLPFFFPSQLELDNLTLPQVLEVARGFFDLLKGTRQELQKQGESLKDSETGKAVQ